MQSKWIEHKGKRIFFADYSGFENFEAFKAEADYSTSITITQPDDSILLLVDVTGTVGNQEMVNYIQESANKDKEKMKKTAVVGVSGYRRIFLRAVIRFTGMDIKDFDNIEDAKDWLVQD